MYAAQIWTMKCVFAQDDCKFLTTVLLMRAKLSQYVVMYWITSISESVFHVIMLLKCHYLYYIYYMNCDISCLSEWSQSSRIAIAMPLKKAPVGSIGLGRMKIQTHNHCLLSRWSDPVSCWSRMGVATEGVIGGNVGFLLSASPMQEFYPGQHGRISISHVSSACILIHARYCNDIIP